MFFWGKRPAFHTIRVKRPTVFALPGFSATPLGPKSQVEETERSMALFRQYLQACRADAYFGLHLPCADILKPYLDQYPEEKSLLRQLIQQERCGASACINHPFASVVSGEALLRNLLLGVFSYERQLGWTSLATLIRGTDALFPQLPQLFQQCGLLAAVLRHENDEDSLVSAPELFQFMAPNGDMIFIRRLLEPTREAPISERAQAALQAEQGIRSGSMAALLLELDGANPPSGEWVGCARELAGNDPSIQCAGTAAQHYFSYIHSTSNEKEKTPIPIAAPDFSMGRAWQALTRRDLKAASHLAESRLFEAELWTAFAESLQIQIPQKPLRRAWRQLIFGQNRQAILGLDNEISFIDVLGIVRESLELAESQRAFAIQAIADQVDSTGKNSPYTALIFNPLPWPRDGILITPLNAGDSHNYTLIDSLGGEIPYEIEAEESEPNKKVQQAIYLYRNLPAAGYIGIKRQDHGPNHAPLIKRKQSQSWLENDFLRVEIDPDRGGGIVSLYDKEAGREFISEQAEFPANALAWLIDRPTQEPHGAPLQTIRDISSEHAANCAYYEGPVTRRLVVRVEGPGPCALIQELRLYDGMPFLDCHTILQDCFNGPRERSIENGDHPQTALAMFPLALPGARPVFEDRFYAKAGRLSPVPFSSMRKNEANGMALSLNSGYRWVDVSWSFLIRFMDGQSEIASLAVGPCGIVAPPNRYVEAQHRLTAHLLRHGVTSILRHTLDSGKPPAGAIHFCLGPREEHPMIQRLLDNHSEASAYYEQSMEQFGMATMVLPGALEDKDVPSSAIVFIAGNNEKRVRQSVDEIVHSTVAHRWDCPASALFIPELPLVEDAGMAVFTRSPAVCALDEDGVLGMGLVRTTPFDAPSTTWPGNFTEQKTNIAHYRLYPHVGDWRHAEIPRRAMEYNHAPVIKPVQAHSGVLPPSMSFLSLEPGNILVSAIKTAGFEESAAKRSALYRNSLVVRIYEAHGEESNIWLECFHPIRRVKPLTLAEKPPFEKREVFRENQFVRGVIHANDITTLRLDLKPEIQARAAQHPADNPVRISSRYWRQNAGCNPEAFIPLAVTIRGSIRQDGHNHDATVHHLDLVLVNHSEHEPLLGEATLDAPPYFRILPNRIDYRLEPGAYQVVPFRVLMATMERAGFVRARATYESYSVEDCIQFGPYPEFDLRMTLDQEGFHVHLSHAYPYSVSGTIQLISPIETWPQELVGEIALSSITSFVQDFDIPPSQESTICFPIQEMDRIHQALSDHHWLVIKLAAHHTLRYYHIRLDGRSSEGLGKILIPPYVD